MNKTEPKKILIVEDELAVMMSVMDTLEVTGFEVQRAYSGADCMKVIKSGYYPDLILLDLMLPDTHGFEVYKQLRTLPALKNTKIAAFTAVAAKDAIQQMNEMGFDNIFHKPYSPEKLIEEIKRML